MRVSFGVMHSTKVIYVHYIGGILIHADIRTRDCHLIPN